MKAMKVCARAHSRQQTADSVVKVESLGSKILTHGPDSSVGRGPWTYLLQNPKNNHYSVVKDLKL